MEPAIFTCKWKERLGGKAGVLHPQITNHENSAKQNICHSMTQDGMLLSMHSHMHPPVHSSFVCGGVFLKEMFYVE